MNNNQNKNTKIGIIGAGYMGLVTAYQLGKKGYDITILEKEDRVAGLIQDFKIHGVSLEKLYHFFYKTDHFLLELVKELGIDDQIRWYESSIALYSEDKHYPFMTPLDLLKFKPLSFFDRIRAGVVAFYLQKIKDWHKFQHWTAYDWMTKYAGHKVRDVIWTPLLKGKFDKYYKEISMIWLWKRIKVRADSKDKGDTTEKLGQLTEGFHIITKRLIEELEKKEVKIQLKTSIKEIKKDSEKIKVITDNDEILFDKVIITTPSPVTAKLLEKNLETKDYVENLRKIDYLSTAVIVFSTKQKISDYYWYNVNDEKAPFVLVLDLTNLVGTEKFKNNYVYYLGTYRPYNHRIISQLNQEELIQEWFTYLQKMFPHFNQSQVQEKHLFRFHNAQHIVTVDYENRIPEYQTPIKGLYVANFSQIFPDDRGSNYAVSEAKKIAEIIATNN